MHSLGSGTQLLEKDWTDFFSGVARHGRWRDGVGHVLEFTLERLTSLQLQVRDRSLTIVSAYKPNISVEYLAFLEA